MISSVHNILKLFILAVRVYHSIVDSALEQGCFFFKVSTVLLPSHHVEAQLETEWLGLEVNCGTSSLIITFYKAPLHSAALLLL